MVSPGVQHRNGVTEAGAEATGEEGSETDLGDEHDHLLALLQDGSADPQIDLGLTSARDTVKQPDSRRAQDLLHCAGLGFSQRRGALVEELTEGDGVSSLLLMGAQDASLDEGASSAFLA